MTPEQRARLEAWARTSTTGKNYFVPDDDSLFPAIHAALAHIDALEARVGDDEPPHPNSIAALAAERDALVKVNAAESDRANTEQARAEQAERERDEARALVRHLQSELRAEVDGCKEAERTAAALKTAIAAVLPELVVMAHEPHCEVLAPEIRDSFRRAVQAFTAALAPTKEEA